MNLGPLPTLNTEEDIHIAEEQRDEGIPDEISILLEQEEKIIHPFKEPFKIVNLGTEEDRKEVRIGAQLSTNVKTNMIELLKEYVNVFAWSYQDMQGFDTNSMEHKLPLKP